MPNRRGNGIDLLADPTRRRIIALLAVRTLRPSTIATLIGLSRPATSHQLRLMVRAGLIDRRRSRIDGRSFVYSVSAPQLGPITAWLAGTSMSRTLTMAIDDDGKVREG